VNRPDGAKAACQPHTLDITRCDSERGNQCRLCGEDCAVGTICLACAARPPRKKSHVYNLKWKPERYYNQFKRYD